MIKLIATDVDGTLVKESSKDIYPEMITMIQKLMDAGIYFVIASGRQYGSVSKMFAEVGRDMFYIVENGAHILENNRTIGLTKMRREDIVEIMTDLRQFYPQCHVVASAPEGSFLETKDEAFIRKIRDQYRNDVTLVDDILAADVEYVKLAIWEENSIREKGENYLIPKWKERVKTCMAGAEWVDFMDYSVDKGNALAVLQKRLNVTPQETMVFGDNENDIGLLRAAEESYAVETAVDSVKAAAKYICGGYEQKGVYHVLESFYQTLV